MRTPLPAAEIRQVKIAPQSWEPWRDPGVRFKHVEIQINTACDLDCHGCDRMSDVISDPNMSVDQVRLFVRETEELGWEWERIRVLGGEPTLHPHFAEIVHLLLDHRAKKRMPPHVFLQVLTNGLGKAAEHRAWLQSEGVSLHAESKTKGETPLWFNNTRIVPVDRDPTVGELPPCGIFGIRGCGVALTRHGFFLDGAGASAARVAGHDIGVMHLRDVSWDRMLDQAKVLCRICGHWNEPTADPAKPETMFSELVSKTGEVTGPYWVKALAEFHRQKPAMRIYGRD